MSVKLPVISGERLIKILVRKGFSVRRQAGSHVVLQKGYTVFSVHTHYLKIIAALKETIRLMEGRD
jgi:predicted RNA binding protein YcfA (HicA-like mRNA interferase family)